MKFVHKLLRQIDVGEANGENLLFIALNIPRLQHPRSLPLWFQLSVHQTPPNLLCVFGPFDPDILSVLIVLIHCQLTGNAAVHPLLRYFVQSVD